MLNREEALRASPMVRGFLATALEDLQFSGHDEGDERDTGTIYTCPDAAFERARAECEAFAAAAGDAVTDSWQDLESIGSDLYLERAGHGAGFRDRQHDSDRDESRAIGERLSAAVSPRGSLEMYLGDDGQAYFA